MYLDAKQVYAHTNREQDTYAPRIDTKHTSRLVKKTFDIDGPHTCRVSVHAHVANTYIEPGVEIIAKHCIGSVASPYNVLGRRGGLAQTRGGVAWGVGGFWVGGGLAGFWVGTGGWGGVG